MKLFYALIFKLLNVKIMKNYILLFILGTGVVILNSCKNDDEIVNYEVTISILEPVNGAVYSSGVLTICGVFLFFLCDLSCLYGAFFLFCLWAQLVLWELTLEKEQELDFMDLSYLHVGMKTLKHFRLL